MRRYRWPALALLLVVGAAVSMWAAGVRIPGLANSSLRPEPKSVSDSDLEVAWISPPTDTNAWSDFVTGLKRAEMRVPGLHVDVSEAFPEHTTSVPEVALLRPPHEGKVLVRWYKSGSGATLADWVQALAARKPAPAAVVGGSSSDRAVELAAALNHEKRWHGDPPLLFITTATIDRVQANPNDPSWFEKPGDERLLTDLHPGRTFRFCFTNSQMADATTDYLMHDPTLMPGRGGWPGFLSVTGGTAGPWPAMAGLAELSAPGPTVFTFEWEDDPFSEDLGHEFKNAMLRRFTRKADPARPGMLPIAPSFAPRLQIPYSAGGFSRANRGESEAVRELLKTLPPLGERSLLIIPTVTAPARRVLLALSERVPQGGRRFVAVTGDGLSVNAVYRDAEFAWPARSIPIPLVLFTHQNPFAWDEPGGPVPPPGYKLERGMRASTQDILLYADIGTVLADAAFPATSAPMATGADELAQRIRTREPRHFDERGNRLGGRGEHVAVLRPTLRYGADPSQPRPDARIEVYRRGENGPAWVLVKAVDVRPEQFDVGRSVE